MNRNLLIASGRRQTWLAALLVWLLSLAAHPGHAQLYYGLSDVSASTTLDQLRRVPLAGGAEQTIIGSNTSGYPSQPALLAYDPANNRLFVANSLNNAQNIVAVNLTTFAVTAFVTPASIANATNTQLTGLTVGGGYLYYGLSDGSASTTLDQLRRVPLAGGAEQTIVGSNTANYPAQPTLLAYDPATNRLFVTTSTANAGLRIAAVELTTFGVSTFASPAANVNATTTQIMGLAVGGGYLYYGLSDGSASTTLDQLRRVPLAGGAEQTIVGSNTANYPAQPTLLAYDPATNRLFVTTSTTNAGLRIAAVELTTFGVSTFASPASIANATTTQLTGLAVGGPGAPTLTTATPNGVTTTSATLGGTITNDGGATVTERGVVYSSTNSTPTIGNGTQSLNGAGTGTFSATNAGLTANTTYYVQAYATNSAGTSYGGVQTFTTPAAPVITTLSPTSGPVGTTVIITGTNYAAGATVTFNGTVATSATVNSATQITAQVPTGATTGSVVVTTSTGSSNGLAFTVTAPTTVTAINPTASSPTNASSVSYTVAFANSVTGLSLSNFSVTTTGTVSGARISSLSGAGTTYTVTLATGTGTGTLRLNLANASGISPSVSNVPFNGATYTLDKTAPTVSISSTAGASGSSTATTPIPFTVTFSESVTGFAAGDLSVTGGTVAGFTGSGSTYTFTVPPSGSGTTVVVDVPANVAQDAAGNTNTAATQFGITYQQPTTATPSLTTPANNSTTNGFPTFAGTAPANAQVTVYLNNTSAAQLSADASGNFSGQLSAAQPSGPYTVYVTAQLIGQSGSANSNTNTFTVDNTPPTVSISSSTAASGSTTTTAPFAYTVTFSENVTGFGAGDVTVSNGTLSNFLGSGSAYTFNVTPTTAGTATTVNVPANVAQDAVGNQNTLAPATYALTLQAPTIVVGPATLPNGTQGTAYSQPLTASGGTAPYTFALTAGAPPSGLTLTSAGTLAGTPTANGSFTFTVTATDASAAPGPYSGTRSYALTIAAPAPAPTLTSWTGTVSTDWYTAGNWTGGVPTATIDATIPAGTAFSPLIGSSTATTRNLTLNGGATLNQSGGTLDVRANLTNNGTFMPTGGTVELGAMAVSNGPNILGSRQIRFWNLTINANGVLLSTGASVQRLLTLSGTLVTQNNPFVLESDATGTALVVNVNSAGFVSGAATVQRYIEASGNTGTSGYRHYSAPVSGATVSSLSTSAYGGSFTAQVNPAYNTADPNQLTLATYPNVFDYDESKIATSPAGSFSDFDKGYQSPASISEALTVGRGYTVQIGNAEKVQFTGSLNTGDKTIANLTYAPTGTAGATSAGWALIGNPYPSPLDWRTMGTSGGSLNGVDGAAYVFQSTSAYSGRYTSLVNNVGAGTGLIASGQGFFVRTSTPGTTGSVTLTNANRVTSYTSPAFQRTTAETRPLLRLSLGLGNQPATIATAQDETFVYFEQGASMGFDGRYDAYKLANPSGYYLGTAATVPAGTPEIGLSIDARAPLAAGAATTIPVWLSVPAGTYTLTATDLLNFAPTGTQIYLRDVLTGTLTNLATAPSYSFNVAANAPSTGRFTLLFGANAPLATQASAALDQAVATLYPNPTATGEATLSATGLPTNVRSLNATLTDVLGRPVATYRLSVAQGMARTSLPTRTLASGIYLLRLTPCDAQGAAVGALPTQRLSVR